MIRNIILLLLFLNTYCSAEDQKPDSFDFSEQGQNDDQIESCKLSHGTARPRIQIDYAKPMGRWRSSIFLIKGKIIGSCIDEAGYYEFGKIKEKFKIPLSDQLNRYEFHITSYEGVLGEIRVYSLDGRQDKIVIEDEVKR